MSTTDTDITFFWRPGCGFCMALERQLASTDLTITYRNIWEDPEAAAFVRNHAQGNEVVPTIQIGSSVLVNPTADEVTSTAATSGGN
ncbi:MAG: NrdH-redoxin [Acidimicrobiaceae bacterium]|jgi:mycoredoxin|nr:NrdH-redoxin [Acidimicrobiaceae bacterium]MEC9112976.1 glutaredoxin domain-containing protein [Actinomycetota bacterium]|tara:strand:- start:1012 stop:1272 length:261 start_codon:yes stop_codon:yes gene_type:complete